MHEDNQGARRREIVFFDEANPRAITKIVPPMLAARIRQVFEGPDAEFFGKPVGFIRKEALRRGQGFDAIDERIRVQFWMEYEHFQSKNDPEKKLMDMSRVVGFAMGKEVFYRRFLHNSLALVFILTPPAEYVAAINIALLESHELIRIALEKFTFNRDGSINGRGVELLLKWEETLHDRLMAMEKISTKLPPPPPGPRKKKNADPEPIEPEEPQESEDEVLKRELEELSKTKKQAESKE